MTLTRTALLGLAATLALLPGCRSAAGHFEFPEQPIVAEGAPPNAAELFGPARRGAEGACLAEPQDGSLFPRNWLRPRIRIVPMAEQNLFELRLRTRRVRNELVVYTASTTWTMDEATWKALSLHAVNEPVTVTLRALDTASPDTSLAVSAPSTFTIAPVDAQGTISYFTMGSHDVPMLRGFSLGEEPPVRPLLAPQQVSPGTRCVSCHSSTPEGEYLAFGSGELYGNGDPAHIGLLSAADGREPPFLTTAARSLLERPQQHMPVFSEAHWRVGDRIMVSILGNRSIIWTDLEAGSVDEGVGWGVIGREGDANTAGAATWSHDGETLVYCSITGREDTGINFRGSGRLYRVPFAGGAGGEAKPLAGAGGDGVNTYYPAFSPDDRFVAYTQSPLRSGRRRPGRNFHNPWSEVWVVPLQPGGAALRLKANDPPSCLGVESPGVTNSWPRWSPAVQRSGDKHYYWLLFSSTRYGKRPQLFVAALVTQGSRTQSYPAIHLWNQPEKEGNLKASWDRLGMGME